MSLKSIGAVSNAFRQFASSTELSANQVIALRFAMQGMNEEAVISFASTQSLSASQSAAMLSATGLEASEVAARLALKGYNAELIKAAMLTAGFTAAEIDAAIASDVFATAEGVATGATSAFSTALKGLWATMLANPILLVIAAFAAAVVAVVKLEEHLKKKTEELIQTGNEAFEVVAGKTDKLTKQAKAVDELAESYANLSKGVDQLTNKNIALSDEDYKEYLRVSNELAELFPDLISGTDFYGNNILDLNGDYETINATLRENIELERERAAVAARNGGSDIFSGSQASAFQAQDKVADTQRQIREAEQWLEELERKGWNLSTATDENNLISDVTRFQNYLAKLGVTARETGRVLDSVNEVPFERIQYDGEELKSILQHNIADLKKELGVYEKDVSDAWSNLRSTLKTSILDDDTYKAMSDAQQAMVQRLIDSLDYSSLNFGNWTDAYHYILNQVVSPLGEGLDLDHIFSDEFDGLLANYQDEMQKAAELGVDLSKTVFGNINTNQRQVLQWTQENLDKYREAIESWEGLDVEDLRGQVSTVLGGWEEFDGIDIAFSPMLQTDHGAVLLDSDTVYDYINALMEEARRRGNGTWTTEDLLAIDAEGLEGFEAEGVRINSLIADIGATAQKTGDAMHFVGALGGIETARKSLEEYAMAFGLTADQLLALHEEGTFEIPFNLITELNGNKISVGAYRQQVQSFLNMVDALVDKGVLHEGIAVALRLQFDLDDVANPDAIADQITDRFNSPSLTQNPELRSAIKRSLASMTASEIDALLSFIGTYDFSEARWWTDVLDAFTDQQVSNSAGIEKLAENYEDLASAADTLAKAQKGLTGSFENGASITKDTYDAIVSLAGGEEALADVIDTTNGYVVKDADALRVLAATAEDTLNTNVKLAASHEKLKYHKLVKELKAVTTSTKTYDGVVKKVIQSIRNEMNAVDLQIRKYALLEQQLLGVTNAFTRFADAQEIDKAADYTDDFGSMLSSLLDNFKNGTYGTESFRAAFEGLIPEDIYGQFTDAGDQIEAGWEYISRTLNSYFTNDNGTITVTQDNVKNLINAGLKTVLGDGTTVFQGSLDSFNLNPAITSLEDFADAMGMTTTTAFALIGALGQYDQNRFGFLESLMPENLENDILRCDRAMADLLDTREQLGKAGKVGTEEWDELEDKLKEVEAEYVRLGKTAREKVADNIALDAQVTAAQQAMDYWQQMIDTYDQGGLQGTNEYITASTNFAQADKELDDLLNKKYQLGEPTEIEVQVALESVQEDIDSIQSQLDKIGKDGSGTVQLGDVELSVDEAREKLAELEAEKTTITAYAELDDEDVMKALETIQDFTISNKSFTVTFSGYDATIKRLQNILNLSNQIRNVQSGLTSNPRPNGSSWAYGTAHASGSAHENGKWGIRKAEKDALLGELGRELIVDPHNGTYRTVGDHGAEFVDIPKDAIIFNHRQTEELLRNRRINSRGRALAYGSAYASPFSGSFGTTYGDAANSESTKVEEEISDQLDELKDQLDELLRNYEHQIFLLERQDQTMRENDPWTKGTYAERIALYQKMQSDVSRLANDYRSMGLDDTSEYIQNLQKQWYEYADAIHDLREQMVQDILDVVDAASGLVDKFQEVNDVFHEAADEYASTGGYITIDTYQKLIAIEPQYMQYLKDENGLLVINDEKINEMIASKTRELALDNALAYVERLRLAKAGQSLEDLNELLYATKGTANATWELVYAQVAALNLNDDQYAAAIHNINAMRSLAENAIEGIGRVSDDTTQALDGMKSGVDDILKYVMDMLKQRINDQIDALENMKDAYSKLIDMKKESLRASKEEADYQKSMASKLREIVKLQSRIESLNLAAMQGDRKAQAELAAAQEEMAKLQEDLADQQADHTLEAQEEALDKMEEAYHAEKDAEIEILQDSISSYQKLYDMAISYIQSHWDTLYHELIEWNTEYGSVLNSEITTAWDNALAAAKQYGDYLTALQKLTADIAAAHNDTVGISTDYDNTGRQTSMPSADDVSRVNQNVSRMKQNSRDWSSADKSHRSELEAENRAYAAQIGEVLYNDRNALRLGNDGWWYLPDGRKLYEVYSGEYHTGGDIDRLGRDEVFAKLKYGETVLDEDTANGLVKQIDHIKKLSSALVDIPDYVGKSALAEIHQVNGTGTVNNVTNNNSNSHSGDIVFGDTIINGAAPDAIQQHFKLTEDMKKEIARWLGFRF